MRGRKMESIEIKLQVLSIAAQKLQREVDNLRQLCGNIAPHHLDTEASMPGFDELFNIPLTRKDMRHTGETLTNREIQILNYVADGNTNKQIAYILGISEQTIKNHVKAILYKLNANDRAHAVAIAMRYDWLLVKRKNEDVIAHVQADLEPLRV
jgi:DNA-binding NarL/FixJ family response regulator